VFVFVFLLIKFSLAWLEKTKLKLFSRFLLYQLYIK